MNGQMATPADTTLWVRAQSGDADAFGLLYERHARAVQSFLLWRVSDPPLAEDLTSVVFLEAWRGRERSSLTTPTARPLLLGVATNVLRGHWRGRRRHAAAVARIAGATCAAAPDVEDDTIARVDALREVRAVRAALHALPRRELDVLALVALAGLTYEETAAALAIPVGTVRSRMSRARARLGEPGGAPASSLPLSIQELRP